MQRIMVIGCCGSGKSTLSKKLHSILGLELIHLDQHFFDANWVEPSTKEWEARVRKLLTKNAWIMDGNYGGTMHLRMEKADTIVFLNFSTLTCLYRVVKRVLKYHGKTRPDMKEGCRERFNLGFLHYVATFKIRRETKLLKLLEVVRETKSIFVLKNDTEVTEFVDSLQS